MSETASGSTQKARGLLQAALVIYKKMKDELPKITQKWGGDVDQRYLDLDNIDKHVSYAVDDLLQAKELDETATIRDGSNTIDFDELTARMLLIVAIAYSNRDRCIDINKNWDLQHGAEALRKYLTYKPDDLEAHLLLAKIQIRLGDEGEGLAILHRIRETDPSQLETRKLIELMEADKHFSPYHRGPTSMVDASLYPADWCLHGYDDFTFFKTYPLRKLP